MQTAEEIFVDELNNLPEVEYPAEVTERWAKIAEIADLKLPTGELQPKSLEDFAREHGLKIG
ncbi:MAG: hypothetical protein FWC23_00065 [Chitinispirillia bacterium]|nr:hypothetical protein [Chitinispirillia bacterium]MCL2267571.1 hypothetical protein [Chitinispirillia bacterium]